MVQHILQRIIEIELRGFRGFAGSKSRRCNTDADLVLLLGPNGTGKTSLLEALQLLLTGTPLSRERAGQATDGYASLLALRRPAPNSPSGPEREGSFELRATALIEPVDAGLVRSQNATLVVTGAQPAKGPVQLRHSVEPESWTFPPDPWGSGAPSPPSDNAAPVQTLARALPETEYSAAASFDGACLQARLTSFFQHDVSRILDDAAEGRTVLDLVEPIPARLRHLGDVLGWVSEAIGERIRRERAEFEEAARAEDRAALGRYRDALEELLEFLAEVDPVGVAVPDGSSADQLARAVSEICTKWEPRRPPKPDDVPARLASMVASQERRWREHLERQARGSATDEQVRAWQARLEQLKADLEELKQGRPEISEEAVAFRGALLWRRVATGEVVDEQLPGLLPTLEALQAGLDAWRQAAARSWGPRPAELQQELEALRPDALAAFTADLRDWTTALEEDLARRKELGREQQELEKKLQSLMPPSEALRQLPALVASARNVPREAWARLLAREAWERDAANRDRRVVALESLKREVEDCATQLERQRARDPHVLEKLKRALSEITARFSVAGQPEVRVSVDEKAVAAETSEGAERRERLSARARLEYSDGRGLGDLSSGQQSQVAVSFLVAQNLLVAQGEPPLDRGMPHRILLLDDVSSTYDLTNLVRESILWRQLAYTNNANLRRQIFLASHHEDLTNQLIDHLVPPAGFSMRVLRFTGWEPDEGPVIESFDVEPGRCHNDPWANQAFSTHLEALFHGA